MTSIFVAKLDFGVTNEELKAAFEAFGNVAKVNIATDKETGKPRGFAFVEMFNDEEAQEAISQLDGKEFNGRRCVVKEAEDRSGGKPAGGGRPFDRNAPRGGDSTPHSRPASRDNDGPQRPFTPPVAPEAVLPTDISKKKKTPSKPQNSDTTADGKSKKPKMNAYKKSGKDNLIINDDDELDEDFDLFGRDEDDDIELDEDYSKYLVNSDDDDYEDDEEYDEDFDDEDDLY